MLRSYQYTEKSYMDYSMQSNLFQMKEIETARRYVENNHIKRDMKKECPLLRWVLRGVCSETWLSVFFYTMAVPFFDVSKNRKSADMCERKAIRGIEEVYQHF